MGRVLLDNEKWDFGTNCYVCEPKNERGLGIPFYHDIDAATIVAEFTPETHHSGAPAFAHGGLCMALLDEGMAWAIIAIEHRFGVTRKIDVSFERPVRIGQPYTVSCRIESREGQDLVATGEIRDARERACVTARGTFHALTAAEAAQALGQPSEQAKSYTEPGRQ